MKHNVPSQTLAPSIRRSCIEFQGSLDHHGYGQIAGKRADGKFTVIKAHRKAWEDANGPIPPGKWICHKCDNRACINVNHLYLGTPKDNSRDSKERSVNLGAPLGERHGRSKLTEAQVREIKRMIADGMTLAKIARLVNVTHAAISRIKHGSSWSWVN